MPRSKNEPPQYELHARIKGKMHSATYTISDGLITVQYMGRQKTTQIGGSPHDVIGRMLLRELVDELAGNPD